MLDGVLIEPQTTSLVKKKVLELEFEFSVSRSQTQSGETEVFE